MDKTISAISWRELCIKSEFLHVTLSIAKGLGVVGIIGLPPPHAQILRRFAPQNDIRYKTPGGRLITKLGAAR